MARKYSELLLVRHRLTTGHLFIVRLAYLSVLVVLEAYKHLEQVIMSCADKLIAVASLGLDLLQDPSKDSAHICCTSLLRKASIVRRVL